MRKRKAFVTIVVCLAVIDFALIVMAYSFNMKAIRQDSKYDSEEMESRERIVGCVLNTVNFVVFVADKVLGFSTIELRLGPFMPLFYVVLFVIQAWIYYECCLYAFRVYKKLKCLIEANRKKKIGA